MSDTLWLLCKELCIAPWNALYTLYDRLYTLLRWYPAYPSFRRAELYAGYDYFFLNPFVHCPAFLAQHDPDRVQTPYGETPFRTLHYLGQHLGLTPADRWYDLGCGRGRGLFFLHALFQCSVQGVEINPRFVAGIERIIQRYMLTNIGVTLCNMLDLRYDDATVLYLYGSALSDQALRNLMPALASLQAGARIISVTHALEDYLDTLSTHPQPVLSRQHHWCVRYPWGLADVYVYVRCPKPCHAL